MGVAVCEAARDRGARVTLVAGTVSVPIPAGVEVVRAETAAAMQARARVARPRADRRGRLRRPGHGGRGGGFPARRDRSDRKIAANRGRPHARAASPTRTCSPGSAGGSTGSTRQARPAGAPILPRPVLVGFAAETGGLERAAAKLRAKRVDLLVANDVGEPGSGFGTSTNRVTIFAADGGGEPLPLLPKRVVAERILDRVAALLDARDAAAQTGATPAPGRTAS